MKSKKAIQYIKTIKLNKANVDYCLERGGVNGSLLIDIEKAVELAEQEAEEEITHYKTASEESKQREELAWRIVSDKRSEIEALKARAVRAYIESCPHGKSSDCYVRLCTECGRTNYFIQELNEQ